MLRIERPLDHPVITPDLHRSIGGNIQGPSLIKVPEWVSNPLGRYYLYFADHKGAYIRLAYADAVQGPWRIHPPGSLHLRDSLFLVDPPEPAADPGVGFADGGTLSAKRSHSRHIEASTPHIASPDVHVNHEDHCIVMYYHGLEGYAKQSTRVAISRDGLNFTARPEILGRTYFRVFRHEDLFYALAMPGQFYRSRNRYSGFEPGPLAFNRDMRHSAVMVRGRKLYVFWTQVGHAPESILLSTVELPGDWQRWRESEPVQILRPEFDWEGADAPLEPSIRSTAYGHVNQMRDPAIFVEAGSIYLLYAVAGESGIAIARVIID
ncbi:MAG: hypothetical protein CFH40_02595 [Alphaproteobacteria bacterium MarineAlpha10_Bin3]|nr:MAG: hypothetical protein CFH40_02595 [Alphaproteobacteria bacterium MarineAlpha10_Bin3]PPR66569.1 MAG: hypothetical protein CFH09_02595 [Alphaproteobacteria bacterium MarineAlpha4_Bin1]